MGGIIGILCGLINEIVEKQYLQEYYRLERSKFMCCSVSPNVEVSFSETILYAAETINSANKIVHVLGYQNKAQNNVNRFLVSPGKFWNKLKSFFINTIRQEVGNPKEQLAAKWLLAFLKLIFPYLCSENSRFRLLKFKAVYPCSIK